MIDGNTARHGSMIDGNATGLLKSPWGLFLEFPPRGSDRWRGGKMTLKQSLGEGARLAMSWTHNILSDPHLEKEFRFPGEWGGQSLVLKRLFSQAMDPGPCQLAPRMFL